jgi:hypothetical protein
MFADRPPADGCQMTDAIKEGIPDHTYSRVLFDPALDIQWGIGHHGFAIVGGPLLRFTKHNSSLVPGGGGNSYLIESSDQDFKMLHYKWLGAEYIRARHAKTWARLSDRNRMQRWGHHNAPDWAGAYSAEWYEKRFADRVRCIE